MPSHLKQSLQSSNAALMARSSQSPHHNYVPPLSASMRRQCSNFLVFPCKPLTRSLPPQVVKWDWAFWAEGHWLTDILDHRVVVAIGVISKFWKVRKGAAIKLKPWIKQQWRMAKLCIFFTEHGNGHHSHLSFIHTYYCWPDMIAEKRSPNESHFSALSHTSRRWETTCHTCSASNFEWTGMLSIYQYSKAVRYIVPEPLENRRGVYQSVCRASCGTCNVLTCWKTLSFIARMQIRSYTLRQSSLMKTGPGPTGSEGVGVYLTVTALSPLCLPSFSSTKKKPAEAENMDQLTNCCPSYVFLHSLGLWFWQKINMWPKGLWLQAETSMAQSQGQWGGRWAALVGLKTSASNIQGVGIRAFYGSGMSKYSQIASYVIIDMANLKLTGAETEEELTWSCGLGNWGRIPQLPKWVVDPHTPGEAWYNTGTQQ